MKYTVREKSAIFGALIMLVFIVTYFISTSFVGKDGLYDHKLVKISAISKEYKPAPIFNNAPSRALNTIFQPQANRATHGTYSISITTSVSLANLNSAGSVFLEISQDGTSWSTIQSAGTSQTLSIAISLGLNQTTTYNVTGWIPLNWYCRLRTTTTGGATASLANGQEVMF